MSARSRAIAQEIAETERSTAAKNSKEFLEERRVLRAQQCAEALLLAYARNHDGMDSIDWDDVDAAFTLAKQALPGRYRQLVRQIKKESKS